jgi:hypothetical protein
LKSSYTEVVFFTNDEQFAGTNYYEPVDLVFERITRVAARRRHVQGKKIYNDDSRPMPSPLERMQRGIGQQHPWQLCRVRCLERRFQCNHGLGD